MKKQRIAVWIAVCICVFLAGCGRIPSVPGGEAQEQGGGAELEVQEQGGGAELEAQEQSGGPDQGVQEQPEVSVLSEGNIYEPFENFTFAQTTQTDSLGKEQTINECSRWLQVEEIEQIPEVPYHSDLEIRVTQQPMRVMYHLYDDAYEIKGKGFNEAESVETIPFPEEDEPYYVKLELVFGDEKNNSGYQYFFRIMPDETGDIKNENPVTAIGTLSGSKDSLVLNMRMENRGDRNYTYDDNAPMLFSQGEHRLIRIPVRPELALAQTVRTLNTGETAESEVRLGDLYGTLEPGQYRFYQKLTDVDTGEIRTVYAAFEIKASGA